MKKMKKVLITIMLVVTCIPFLQTQEVSAAANGNQIATYAKSHIRKPYVWGAQGPNSFDCSGLVHYVYKVQGGHGAAMGGRTTVEGYWYRSSIPKVYSSPQAGDMVFFRGLGHMGIMISSTQFVHAPQPGQNVQIANIAGWDVQGYGRVTSTGTTNGQHGIIIDNISLAKAQQLVPQLQKKYVGILGANKIFGAQDGSQTKIIINSITHKQAVKMVPSVQNKVAATVNRYNKNNTYGVQVGPSPINNNTPYEIHVKKLTLSQVQTLVPQLQQQFAGEILASDVRGEKTPNGTYKVLLEGQGFTLAQATYACPPPP